MESTHFQLQMIAEILLDQGFAKPLDYEVPKEFILEVGMRVLVPLKSTLKKGVVTKLKSKSPYSHLKPIAKILDAEVSKPLWELAQWMSIYYCTPLQKVLKCFTLRKEVKEKLQIFLKLNKTHEEAIQEIAKLRVKHPAQAEALEQILNCPKGAALSDLQVGRSAISSLIQKKWILSYKQSSDLLEEEYFPTFSKNLNSEQQTCLDQILVSLEKKSFAAHLIHGVTGSGKTEVYMQAIAAALNSNRSAIMLVPEISLTSQTIERFKARFSEKIALLHHRRSLGQRSSAWEDLKRGKTKLVIGARSALFAPAQNLGLIIIDEEHDSSYKQSDEMPCYHGRDTAVMRAYLENCTILLGSATPSIESRYNAQIGKYHLHELKKRATSAPLPKVKIVDMVQTFERNKGFTHFSDELIQGLKKRLDCGEQALLFLNRRGYHRMQICYNCRHVVKCKHCDLALTFHQKESFLECHLCNFRQPIFKSCPNCENREPLQFRGFGTEHVEKALHALFPEVRTLRMDRDTTKKKNSHEELFKQFRSHKADVLIGTQMIAKGFHFPSVTLVGILGPDTTLNIPDFRSSEHTFQLLTQVSGRAGRAELNGEVIIQTFLPDHPILKLAATQDYDSLYKQEIEERKQFHYPPFCHLVKVSFADLSETVAKDQAESAYQKLKNLPVEILPVMPAGHAKVKDQYRFQFVIKTAKIGTIAPSLREIEKAKIDIDPTSIFF